MIADKHENRMEYVKQKIHHLLKLGSAELDNSEVRGDIEAAMKLAQNLLQKYHLDRADIETENTNKHIETEEQFEKVSVKFHGKNISIWENTLYNAVKILVGTVEAYKGSVEEKTGSFRAVRSFNVLYWYGPAEDAHIAAELYEDWSHVIATMAVGKYGTFLRKDGARYASGFASGLLTLANKAKEEREKMITPSTTAIVRHSGGTLEQVLALKKQKAKNWLTKEQNIQLNKSRKSHSYKYNHSNIHAFLDGQSDGLSAAFTAERKKKLN